jgi:hypothetical protein
VLVVFLAVLGGSARSLAPCESSPVQLVGRSAQILEMCWGDLKKGDSPAINGPFKAGKIMIIGSININNINNINHQILG